MGDRKVAEWMKANGLSQAWLARKVGVREEVIHQRVNGKVKWSPDLARRVLIALRAEIETPQEIVSHILSNRSNGRNTWNQVIVDHSKPPPEPIRPETGWDWEEGEWE